VKAADRDIEKRVTREVRRQLGIVSYRDRRLAESPLHGLFGQWVSAHLPSEQITRILELTREVFGDTEIAEQWLQEPNLATDNNPPITLLGSDEGYARVKTLLERIDYGVLA
jgi:uncharacterized protein (DUF2384 family)